MSEGSWEGARRRMLSVAAGALSVALACYGLLNASRIGPTPPPPTRSAEQVCEDANLGGPCRAPDFRAEDVVRRRHTQ